MRREKDEKETVQVRLRGGLAFVQGFARAKRTGSGGSQEMKRLRALGSSA